MVANASELDAKRREVKELESRRRELYRTAQRYAEGSAYFDPTLPVRRSKTGRTRLDIRGNTLDLSNIQQQINYRFLNGDLVIGNLDKKAARMWNGKTWPEDRPTAELIDLLYQTSDGKGFFTVLWGRGVKLNPMAILQKKAGGTVVRAG
jgi:hypothetical protein